MILFGCHSSLCVVVELDEELPSPADIQLAHSRLRSLCLGGGYGGYCTFKLTEIKRNENLNEIEIEFKNL